MIFHQAQMGLCQVSTLLDSFQLDKDVTQIQQAIFKPQVTLKMVYEMFKEDAKLKNLVLNLNQISFSNADHFWSFGSVKEGDEKVD